MKTLRILSVLITLLFLASCGSSERVITNDGKVYEVKGSTIKNNGVEVTERLSDAEKESINALLDKKEKAREAFEKEYKTLEEAIAKQQDLQKAAENKQEELEDKLEILENNREEKQDARDNYATIKERYNNKKKEFKKLKKEGELSPNDVKRWKEKLSQLKSEVMEAKNKL